MATQRESPSEWRTTIIISRSLQHHELSQALSSMQHHLRFSHSLQAGAVIFPLAGAAFLLVDPGDVSVRAAESGLLGEIEAFAQVHRNCFVLLYAPTVGEKEVEVLSEVQTRLFGSNLKVLPVRNTGEIIKGMLTIAKATSKVYAGVICNRISVARAHIVESSPVWEMLRDQL